MLRTMMNSRCASIIISMWCIYAVVVPTALAQGRTAGPPKPVDPLTGSEPSTGLRGKTSLGTLLAREGQVVLTKRVSLGQVVDGPSKMEVFALRATPAGLANAKPVTGLEI